MRRFLLAAAATATITVTADAQSFIRPAPFGFQPTTFRINGGGAFFPTATGGYGFTYRRSYAYRSPVIAGTITPAYFNYVDPKVVPSYYYGGVGMAGGVDAIGLRQQAAMRQAQLIARNDAFARQQAFDKFAVAARPEANAERLNAAPEPVRQALTTATNDQITSGQALNDLLGAIHKAQPVAGSGEAVLSPDLLAGVTFAGGPSADLLEIAQNGKVSSPFGLTAYEFDAPRASLERTTATIAADLNAGRRVNPTVTEQLSNDIKRLRNKQAVLVRENRAGADTKAVAAFFDRMTAVVEKVKQPGVENLVVPDWQTSGATVAELSDYLKRHGLTFAPAGNGNEAAYLALHRSLAGYLGELWK